MAKVYFLFGIHNHQPVGNFPHIFEEAFRKCYYPFISILDKYPKIKCNVHISGPLYDWLLKHQREFLIRLKKMVNRHQIEIISGAYYEPILPLIPDKDKLSQIELMNAFIKKHFGRTPQGIWLAERVWEPYLVRIINSANLQYTFLDDTHFRYAGLTKKEFVGYYLTEEEYKSIYVFPISKALRYKIPFSRAEEAIDLLRNFYNPDQDTLITLFDDGEKFGFWPYTFDWVYNKKWLETFFSLLTENIDFVETVTAQEAIERFNPQGIVYLPTASYEEMEEWVLEPESFDIYECLEEYLKKSSDYSDYKNFVRGGFFRNYYRKYPRLNFMHKRMLYLSQKLHAQANPEKEEKLFNYLWKAQCNCGYWHGIFGGFYLGHIRSAIYENLIKAENELDKKNKRLSLSVEETDIDLDGYKEIVVKNREIICVFSSKGGTLLELSLRRPAFNFLNTITRRKESYHKKVREKVKKGTGEATTIHDIIWSKDKDLDRYLIYDKYEKTSLIDHILEKNFTIDNFYNQERIKPLANKSYTSSCKRNKDKAVLIYTCKDEGIEFSKKIEVGQKPEFEVRYKFTKTDILKSYDFGVEFNLFLPTPEDIFIGENKLNLEKQNIFDDISLLIIKDFYKKVKIIFKCDHSKVLIIPLYTVSSSESGFEKVYQQIEVLFINKSHKTSFSLGCELKKGG